METETKTFTEWEQAYGIAILNADETHLFDEDGQPRTLTFVEFEQRVMDSLVTRRPVELTQPRRKENVVRPLYRRPAVNHTVRGAFPLLVWVTLPALAYILVAFLLRLAGKFVRIHWLVSLCVLLADLAILVIQPVGALISGPAFIWYRIFNWIFQWAERSIAIGQHQLLHRSLNLTNANHALFGSVTLGGSPLPLYFGISQAIVSSLFWATVFLFIKELAGKSRRAAAEPSHLG